MMLENMIRKEVREMPPSGIRKYFDIVNEMEDVISLGVGEPDFVTPWNVREAGIYSLEQGDTHYSSNAGFIELREEIAKYLYRKFDFDDDNISFTGREETGKKILRKIHSAIDEGFKTVKKGNKT